MKRPKHPIEQFMGEPGEELKIVQVIEERDVEALGIRATALNMAFKLRGDYAPKRLEIDPDTPVPAKVINTSAILAHG